MTLESAACSLCAALTSRSPFLTSSRPFFASSTRSLTSIGSSTGVLTWPSSLPQRGPRGRPARGRQRTRAGDQGRPAPGRSPCPSAPSTWGAPARRGGQGTPSALHQRAGHARASDRVVEHLLDVAQRGLRLRHGLLEGGEPLQVRAGKTGTPRALLVADLDGEGEVVILLPLAELIQAEAASALALETHA